MPANDPATDSLNYGGAPGVTQVEFEETLFEDVEDGDIFWFSNSANSNENHAFRRLDGTSAMDTRNRTVTESIDSRLEVYQKI
tara:strand:+ start:187 stop:435 length:249 start_codon:yes stop_codon:yes gene_type:complete